MENKIILLFLILSFSIFAVEYRTLQQHGETLRNLLAQYVTDNNSQSSTDVLGYLNSQATKTIFTDALASGYSKEKVVFEAYQQSFANDKPIDIIITALHDEVQKSNQINNALSITSWAAGGVSLVSILYMIRSVYFFVRYEKPVMEYVSRSQPYVQFRRGDPVSVNTPLVPEPSF